MVSGASEWSAYGILSDVRADLAGRSGFQSSPDSKYSPQAFRLTTRAEMCGSQLLCTKIDIEPLFRLSRLPDLMAGHFMRELA